MKIVTILLTLALVLSFIEYPFSQASDRNKSQTQEQPIELGLIHWERDYNKGIERAKAENKPVFLLFQEVPGCHGVVEFGKNVLSDTSIIEQVEKNFIPIAIYNNKEGKDAEILRKYREPSWNFQVVRFIDPGGNDIIPRKDGVNTVSELTVRMNQALDIFNKRNNKKVAASKEPALSEIAFAQHCFWTGERVLGGVEGVQKTEAGFIQGREVTRVWYDTATISTTDLISKAKSAGVADRVYTTHQSSQPYDGRYSEDTYRKAPASDQKKQLEGTPFYNKDLSDFQATKVNAFIRTNPQKAKEYLSSP